MNLEELTTFFQWMSIINVGLLIVSTLLIMLLKGVVMRMHAKLFALEANQVAIVVYAYLGVYKLLIIVFNIVPYAALLVLQMPK